LDNRNFDWRPVYRFSLMPLGNRYPCFDKAVEFEETTLEVLVNRNQPAGQYCEEKRRQLKQTVVMPDFEGKCQPPGVAS
jgi:predicted kinase